MHKLMKTKNGNRVAIKIEPELRFHIFAEMKPENAELYNIIHENGVSAISADLKSATDFLKANFEQGEFLRNDIRHVIFEIENSNLDLWTRKFLLDIFEKGFWK